MILVLIESPFAADTEEGLKTNLAYARQCMRDSLSRGEAPFGSHLLYTQVLDDTKASERTQGINAGLAWGRVAALTAVYTDRGISKGMRLGIEAAKAMRRPVIYRQIDPLNPPHWSDG